MTPEQREEVDHHAASFDVPLDPAEVERWIDVKLAKGDITPSEARYLYAMQDGSIDPPNPKLSEIDRIDTFVREPNHSHIVDPKTHSDDENRLTAA